jgi:tetratricopeptide (TPR) repeat protein
MSVKSVQHVLAVALAFGAITAPLAGAQSSPTPPAPVTPSPVTPVTPPAPPVAPAAPTFNPLTATVRCPTPAELTTLETAARAPGAVVARLVDLGQAYLCLKRPKDARDILEAAVALDFSYFDAHFFLGKAYYDLGDFDAALGEYDQLIRTAPARLEPYYQQAVIYARLRRTDDAIRSLNSTIEAALKDEVASKNNDLLADLYIALARQQRIKSDFNSEAQAYQSAQQYRPGDLGLVVKQAQALFDAQNLVAALPLTFGVLGKQPGNADAGVLIADIMERQNQPDRALRELGRVLENNRIPRDRARLLVRRGLLELKLGRNTAALQTFKSASQTDPGSWAARYNYGVLLLPRNPTAALTEFRAALKIQPEDGNTFLGIASAHSALGNDSSAYSAARNAVRFLKDDATRNAARFISGQSAYNLKLYPAAVAEFRTLLATNTSSFQYQFWYGLSLFQTKDFPGAIVALESAVKLNPNNLQVRSTLGAAYLSAKRWKDAETVLLEVVRFDPRDSESWYNLALAVINQGQLEQGKTYLRRAAAEGSTAARQLLAKLR